MSLRLRLSLIIGGAFLIIWVVSACWMYQHMNHQLGNLLDQRLVASSRMVAGLLDQLPKPTRASPDHVNLDDLDLTYGIACEVTSLDGDVLARTNLPSSAILNVPAKGFANSQYDGQNWRTYTLVHGDFLITTADKQLERESLNNSVITGAVVPVLVALVACLGALGIGIRTGLRPLNAMRKALSARKVDSIEPLVVSGLPSELRPLLDTQNQLLQRMANAIERERRFTGDAAHELRSPLTAVTTHLQLAQLSTGESHSRALARAMEGSNRLRRTLEQLLMLARVEGCLSFDDGSDYTAEQIATFAAQDAGSHSERKVQISIANDVANLRFAMPSALAVAALRNLLDNALRYSPVETFVEINATLAGRFVQFTVRDHGQGVSPEDLPHLTERFWRSTTSRGCGLGLAIVKAIVQRCRCEIDFSMMNPGLQVVLNLPVSEDFLTEGEGAKPPPINWSAGIKPS